MVLRLGKGRAKGVEWGWGGCEVEVSASACVTVSSDGCADTVICRERGVKTMVVLLSR
jgi:hypothetical protein